MLTWGRCSGCGRVLTGDERVGLLITKKFYCPRCGESQELMPEKEVEEDKKGEQC